MAGTDFVTKETFRVRFPQFNAPAVSDDTLQAYIDDAVPMFDKCRWDTLLLQGSAYYVAFMLVFDQPSRDTSATAGGIGASNGGMTSTVTMKKAGDLQKQNSADLIGKFVDNPYLSNKYGQRYLQLRKLTSIGAVAV